MLHTKFISIVNLSEGVKTVSSPQDDRNVVSKVKEDRLSMR